MSHFFDLTFVRRSINLIPAKITDEWMDGYEKNNKQPTDRACMVKEEDKIFKNCDL